MWLCLRCVFVEALSACCRCPLPPGLLTSLCSFPPKPPHSTRTRQLNAQQVIHIDMYDKPASMPPLMVNYHRDLAQATTGEEWRSDLNPINITQPEGPSFTVEGNMVSLKHVDEKAGFVKGVGVLVLGVSTAQVRQQQPSA